MVSWSCELSGEPLATATGEPVVVTPSGHVCLRRLLLAKLAETGGVDPFDPQGQRPLAEDQLVELAAPATGKAAGTVPPRPPGATAGYTGLLGLLQQEYDAVVLELFDTRAALQAARQELAQALYQGDAAVRVVARLARERDEARPQLAGLPPAAGAAAAPASRKRDESAAAHEANGAATAPAPAAKRPRTEAAAADAATAALPLHNDLPAADLAPMVAVWEALHRNRKALQKQAAAAAPSPEQLAGWTDTKKAWHKTTCKTLSALTVAPLAAASDGDPAAGAPRQGLVTSGSDKQIMCYDPASDTVVWSIPKAQATCLDARYHDAAGGLLVAAGHGRTVSLHRVAHATAEDGSETFDGSAAPAATAAAPAPVLAVSLHPSGRHVVAATRDGVCVFRAPGADGDATAELEHVATFSADGDNAPRPLTCGCLHPDGLIYVAGTEAGELQIWDLKNKLLASTLSGGKEVAMVGVAVSDNGYHIASVDAAGTVLVWDLRKQSVAATLNEGGAEAALAGAAAVAFDRSGRYLAYGGPQGVRVAVGKEWTVAAAFDGVPADGGLLAWAGGAALAAAGRKGRQVHLLR